MNSRRLIVILALVSLITATILLSRHVTGVHVVSGVARPAADKLPPYNVVLITLDTTRADHLGCYGDQQALTPALNMLAARGTLFESAYTSCPQTLPAHATLLTGLQPPSHGLHANGKQILSPNIPTLASVFSEHGYRTAAFVAAYVLNAKFGLNHGFGIYDDDLSGASKQEVAEPLSVYRPGNVVMDAALSWLNGAIGNDETDATGHRPFFLWVHLYDPHFPYAVHPELAGTRFEGAATYDAGIAFMDYQVARLTAFLEEHHLTEHTLIVAVGDHGEGLQDHGEVEHGYLLNEEVLHVPLIMSLPGLVHDGQRVSAVVSSIDVFPTILDVLGMSTNQPRPGRSLLPGLRGEPIDSMPSYAETDLPYAVYGWNPLRSLTTPEWKFIRTTRTELYDRQTDRREIYNLAAARAQQTQVLDQQLAAIEHGVVVQQASSPQLSEADKSRLQALGYAVEGQANAALPPVAASGLRDIKDMLGVKHLDTQLTRGLAYGSLTPVQRLTMAQELVRRSPETAGFQRSLGEALIAVGKAQDAVASLQEAVRLNPDLAETHAALGQAFEQQGHLDEAEQQYREAIRIDPDYVAAYFGIGNVLAARGPLDEALGYYAETVRRRPDFAPAHYNMANTLVRRGKIEAAIEHFQETIRLQPRHVEAHYNLANLLRARGQLDDALAQYAAALDTAPDFIDARNNLGATLVAQHKLNEARQEYERLLAQHPQFARAHYNLGRLLVDQGECKHGFAELRTAIAERPDAAEFLDGFAVALLTAPDTRQRDPRRAVELATKASALMHDDDAGLLGTLANAYAAAGRPGDAMHTAERAARLARAHEQPQLADELERRVTANTRP